MAWAVALAILGGALVVGGMAGRRAGIVGLFAVIAVIGTLVATVVPKLNHLEGAGDRTWRPATVSTATDGYGLGVGDATLDLTALAPGELDASDPANISVSVGIGQLTIQVPTGTAVEVRSSIGAGDVHRVSGFDQGPLFERQQLRSVRRRQPRRRRPQRGRDPPHGGHRRRPGPADRRGQGRARRDPGRGGAVMSDQTNSPNSDCQRRSTQ